MENDYHFKLIDMNLPPDYFADKAPRSHNGFSSPIEPQPSVVQVQQVLVTPQPVSLGHVSARKYKFDIEFKCDLEKANDPWFCEFVTLGGELVLNVIGDKEVYSFVRDEVTYKVSRNVSRCVDPRPSLGTHYILFQGEQWFLDVE